jgi:hypothetical protein
MEIERIIGRKDDERVIGLLHGLPHQPVHGDDVVQTLLDNAESS